MGSTCCTGDTEQNLELEKPVTQEIKDFEDWGDNRQSPPSQSVAFNINNLPLDERSEGRLSQLQETINIMKANQRGGKKKLAITRIHHPGASLPDPYYIRSLKAVYIGEWKYINDIQSSVPGGLGRLYTIDQIIEGQIITLIPDDEKNKSDFKENIADTMIRQNKRRAKFFHSDKEKEQVVTTETTKIIRNIKIVLDGQGRKFSRSKETSGDFQQGQLNGKGQQIIKYDKDVYEYKGEFTGGKKNGKGVQAFKNTVYDGQFRNNLKEGKGILTLFISNKFQRQQEQETKEIQRDNQQRDYNTLMNYIQKYIKIRIQQFQLPLQEGLKKQFNWVGPKPIKTKPFIQDSDFLLDHLRRTKYSQHYKGQFLNNMFQGFGKYTWFNGKCYEGQWDDGKMSGLGQFYWQKGGYYYQGQYLNDLKHGKGTMIWSLTKRYRGGWAFGMKHGYGEFIQVKYKDEETVNEQNENKDKGQTQGFGLMTIPQGFMNLPQGLMNLPQNLQNLNPLNLLMNKDKKQEKKRPKVIFTVTGGLFDRDDLIEQYFSETRDINIDLQKIQKEYSLMFSKVKGVRVESDEEEQS